MTDEQETKERTIIAIEGILSPFQNELGSIVALNIYSTIILPIQKTLQAELTVEKKKVEEWERKYKNLTVNHNEAADFLRNKSKP